MNPKSVTKYQCPSCGEVHDKEYQAEDCCKPEAEEVTMWECDCGEVYDDREHAQPVLLGRRVRSGTAHGHAAGTGGSRPDEVGAMNSIIQTGGEGTMDNPHINIASSISELAVDLDHYKSVLPDHLRLSAINCVREMHKFAQELLGDDAGAIYGQDEGSAQGGD